MHPKIKVLFISLLFLVTPIYSSIIYSQQLNHSQLDRVENLYNVGGLTDQIQSSLISDYAGTPSGYIVIFNSNLLALEGYNRLLQTPEFSHEEILRLEEFPVLILDGSDSSLDRIPSLKGVTKILPNLKLDNLIDVDPSDSLNGIPQLSMNLSRDMVNSSVLVDDGISGEGVKIAILDSGISHIHPDLAGKISANRSFVKEVFGFEDYEEEDAYDYLGHGTACAGIAAGGGNASNGDFQGIAPQAELINAKVFSALGITTGAAIFAAVDWCVSNEADIISMSFGGGGPDPYIAELATEMAYMMAALDSGVFLVSSSGNSGSGFLTGSAPAIFPGILSVGALNARLISDQYDDDENMIAEYSSRGPASDFTTYPDVLAPSTVYTTLSSGSHFEGVYLAYNFDYIEGDGGDYWLFSGTSAACPTAAGVAALLLQGMREVSGNATYRNPFALYSALAHTAKDTGYDANIQGSGLIDAASAYNYLEDNYLTGNFNVSSVAPQHLPVSPFTLNFPGDMIWFNLTVVTGIPMDVSTSISASLSDFLYLDGTGTITQLNGIGYISGYIEVPWNASQSSITGDLTVTVGVVDYIIPVSFDIRLPKARIFLDNLHSVDMSDTLWNSYHEVTATLIDEGYDVETSPLYSPFRLQQTRHLITYEFLSQYDILVISDVEVNYIQSEIMAIQEFIRTGGSLIVFGSHIPSFNYQTVNEVLSPFEISYTNVTVMNSIDIGAANNWLSAPLLDIENIDSTHPITSNVERFYWQSGQVLNTTSTNAVELAWLDNESNQPILIAYNGTPQGWGRIVVLGNEVTMINRLTGSRRFNSTEYDHKELITNIFNWVDESSGEIVLDTIAVEPLLNATTPTNTQFVVLISDPTTGLGVNITPTVNFTYPNGTSTNPSVIHSGSGIYYVQIAITQAGNHTLNASLTYNSVLYESTTTLLAHIQSPQFMDLGEYSIWDADYTFTNEMIRLVEDLYGWSYLDRKGDSIVFVTSIQNSSPIDVQIHISDIPEWGASMTTRPRTNISLSMDFNGSYWTLTWTPGNVSTGNHVYFITAIDSNNQLVSSDWRQFVILNYEPYLKSNEITVNGETYEDLRESIIQAAPSDTLTFSVSGYDNESSLSEHKVFVLLYHYTSLTIPLVPGVGILTSTVQQLTYNTDRNNFEGEYIVPSTQNDPLNNQQMDLTDRTLVLIVLIRDPDGGIGLEVALINILPEGSIPSWLIDLLITILSGSFLLICSVISCYLYNRSRKRKRDQPTPQELGPYGEYPTMMPAPIFEQARPQLQRIFCHRCGERLTIGAKFCHKCGTQVND